MLKHVIGFKNTYEVECITPCGATRWTERCHNLVHNDGLDHALAIISATGALQSWFVGLMATTYSSVGTHSATTNAFATTIQTPYSQGTLPAFTAGAIASQSVDNSAAKAAFSINAATTVGGAYLVNNSTLAPPAGTILFGSATFSAGRAVLSGDTLNVQITIGTEVT